MKRRTETDVTEVATKIQAGYRGMVARECWAQEEQLCDQ